MATAQETNETDAPPSYVPPPTWSTTNAPPATDGGHESEQKTALNFDDLEALTLSNHEAHRTDTAMNDSEAPPPMARRMSTQLSVQLESSGISSYLPNSMASMLPGLASNKHLLHKTYFCNICFMKNPIDDGFTLRGCQHQFCVECLQQFCTNKINNGSVHMKCFHPVENQDINRQGDAPYASCGIDIDEQDVHQLVDADTWSKYNKFKSNLENTMSRQCPFCDHTQIGDKDKNVIHCGGCDKEYCLVHSNAHPMTESCESYELRTAKENKMNEMALQELGDKCKQCPQCDFRIIKNGGCNHMKCVKCGCSFCWLCMEQIEDVEIPSHYSDENSKCKDQQFTGDDGERPPLPILIIMMCCLCIFCIPGVALGLVFGCLCHPCVLLCFNQDGSRNVIETVSVCSFIWMIIPVAILFAIFLLVARAIKSIYDAVQLMCPCLPNCPASCGW
eukprot:CAMPEP_0202731360 /NCGR_PEP_ID=MMETSP1385-20130828/187109_1 /ASSEMBLY_ACC=CAM_ASM_000861 /TAXON_ID=933848 /ORGANISM="Elphidium margaritaceum" /LENGTH=447 /DNA_ID=CAMNT_0049397655 /DNA_START=915 /DNA_END=2255 /DNA_ORIENTATION=+